MLWNQHRDRFEVAGIVCRRIPYFVFKELTACMTSEDMATVGRLNAKRQAGAVLTQEETDRLTEIASRWPVDGLRAACVVPPISEDQLREKIASMPRRDADEAERILDMCATPEVPEADLADPLAVRMAATGLLAIDPADLTAGQGYALLAMLTPKGAGQ